MQHCREKTGPLPHLVTTAVGACSPSSPSDSRRSMDTPILFLEGPASMARERARCTGPWKGLSLMSGLGASGADSLQHGVAGRGGG